MFGSDCCPAMVAVRKAILHAQEIEIMFIVRRSLVQAGFTLVELLVVIAISLCLLACFFPPCKRRAIRPIG